MQGYLQDELSKIKEAQKFREIKQITLQIVLRA